MEIGRVNNIGDKAFYECKQLETVKCSAQMPPELGENVFNIENTKLKIFVPRGYGETYKRKWKPY